VLWSQTPLQAEPRPPVYTTYAYNTQADPNSAARGQLLKVYHLDTDQNAANGAEGYYELTFRPFGQRAGD